MAHHTQCSPHTMSNNFLPHYKKKFTASSWIWTNVMGEKQDVKAPRFVMMLSDWLIGIYPPVGVQIYQ